MSNPISKAIKKVLQLLSNQLLSKKHKTSKVTRYVVVKEFESEIGNHIPGTLITVSEVHPFLPHRTNMVDIEEIEKHAKLITQFPHVLFRETIEELLVVLNKETKK